MLIETCLEREEPADTAPEAGGWAERLTPRYVAKPWGRRDGLPAPDEAQPLGERIFEAPDAGLAQPLISPVPSRRYGPGAR